MSARVLAVLLAAALLGGRAGAADVLPLRLLPTGDIGGLLVVELQHDGQPSRWLIDTGSSRHLVAPAFVRRHALSTRGRVGADTAFGRISGPEVAMPALTIGTRSLPAASAVMLDLRPLAGAAADDIDGVLGAPWLDAGAIAFDFAAWTVAVAEEAGDRCPDGHRPATVERLRGVPVLTAIVDGGEPERVLFDTGNAAALVRIDADDAPARAGVSLPGVPAVLARAAHVAIGPLERREVPVAHLRAPALRAALPADVAALAGVALFEGARLTLDLPRRRACIEKGERTVPGGFGFTLDRERDGLVISGVLEASPAAAAGLRAGDVVTAWNGSTTPPSTAAAWSEVRGQGELTLVVERPGGAARTVTLRRAHFLPALPR